MSAMASATCSESQPTEDDINDTDIAAEYDPLTSSDSDSNKRGKQAAKIHFAAFLSSQKKSFENFGASDLSVII